MFGQRFGIGLAATALGMLVLAVVLAGGLLILDRLVGGGLFGANPLLGDPYAVLEGVDVAEPAEPTPDDAPQQPDLTPTPTTTPPPPAPPPASPAPEPGPVPNPGLTPVAPPIPPPDGDGTVESVVRLSTDTVDGLTGTVEDVVGLPAGLLSSPPAG